jgi:hypothetical protein
VAERLTSSADESPIELLWHSLAELFEDNDASYAGPDVGFDGLSGSDVLRVWNCLIASAKQLESELVQLWNLDNEPVEAAPEPTEAGALVARGELGYMMVGLDGIESSGVLLPQLRVELWPNAVSMYWWVGTGWWDAETVGAFADLLGQLRALVPDVRLAYENRVDIEFWEPVSRYLETQRRVREGLV